jgi:hypothetical protein
LGSSLKEHNKITERIEEEEDKNSGDEGGIEGAAEIRREGTLKKKNFLMKNILD